MAKSISNIIPVFLSGLLTVAVLGACTAGVIVAPAHAERADGGRLGGLRFRFNGWGGKFEIPRVLKAGFSSRCFLETERRW